MSDTWRSCFILHSTKHVCSTLSLHKVSLNVYVNVLNVNDNYPEFEKNNYIFNVNEVSSQRLC